MFVKITGWNSAAKSFQHLLVRANTIQLIYPYLVSPGQDGYVALTRSEVVIAIPGCDITVIKSKALPEQIAKAALLADSGADIEILENGEVVRCNT